MTLALDVTWTWIAAGSATALLLLARQLAQRGRAGYLDAELLISPTGLRNFYAGQLRVTNKVDATVVLGEFRLQSRRGFQIVDYAWGPGRRVGSGGPAAGSCAIIGDGRPIAPGSAEVLRFLIRRETDSQSGRVSCRTSLRYALADDPRRAGRRQLKAACVSPFTDERF